MSHTPDSTRVARYVASYPDDTPEPIRTDSRGVVVMTRSIHEDATVAERMLVAIEESVREVFRPHDGQRHEARNLLPRPGEAEDRAREDALAGDRNARRRHHPAERRDQRLRRVLTDAFRRERLGTERRSDA